MATEIYLLTGSKKLWRQLFELKARRHFATRTGPAATCVTPSNTTFRKLLCPQAHHIVQHPSRPSSQISFLTLGSPSGRPVFLLHSSLSCRLEALDFTPSVLDQDLFIIAPDRPGHGDSSFVRRYAILDHADDVRMIAAYLGLKKYHVLGVSAGGAFALGCAARIPLASRSEPRGGGELLGTGVMAGIPPPGWDDSGVGGKGMSGLEAERGTAGQGRGRESGEGWDEEEERAVLYEELGKWAMEPRFTEEGWTERVDGLIRSLPEAERKFLEHPDTKSRFREVTKEALKNGVNGVIWDQRWGFINWGFDLEDVQGPVSMWYGAEDEMVPKEVGVQLREKVKGSQLNILEHVGHFALGPKYQKEIFAQLLAIGYATRS